MAKSITCGHCGGTHASVAEVRACSLNPPPADPPPTGPSSAHPPSLYPSPPAGTAGPGPAPAATRTLPGPPERWAGPEALGRILIVPTGTAAPAPWTDRPRIAASVDADPDTVARLHRAWRERERVVVDWSGPWPPPAAARFEVPFSRLGPDTELPGERLRFVVTANAVVAVGDRVGFAPVGDAIGLGATIVEPAATGDRIAGDVVSGDGTPMWVDGGPLSVPAAAELDPPAPLIPRVHLVAGRLRAVAADPAPPAAELAPDQLAAVGHPGGPARIIAPAGSGKTRVITERTRHLVTDRGLHPATVSLVAYNRRARAEMAARLDDVAGLDIRTLNSLALAIATGRRPFTGSARRDRATIDELEARRLLERLVPGRRRRSLTDPLEPWIDALSACRLGLRDPAEVEEAYGADVSGFVDVLARYREELARRGQLDYDEQILAAIEVLCTDPVARDAARAAASVLLVDEFQDLTPAHLLLIRLIAGPAAEVFAVGDDDQTIYGYTGASPTWLIEFDRFFPGSVDHPLTVNYRCPPAVVTAAGNLLSHNRRRVPKTVDPAPGRADDDALWITGAVLPPAGSTEIRSTSAPAPTPTTDPGPALPLDPAGRTGEQVLVDQVRDHLAGGAEPSDVAVLARVNAALLAPLLHLADAGIPVARPPGVDARMLDRSGTGAALAWLRLAGAPEQRLSGDDLRMVLRRPPRSLHPRIADWVCEQASVADLRRLAGRLNNERDATTVSGLADDIAELRSRHDRGVPAGELLDAVYHEIGLMGAASQLDRSQRVARRAAHADELTALRAVADLAPDDTDLGGGLRDQLDALPPLGAAGPVDDGPAPPLVTLATIHATKGLEWPHVIVHRVGAELHPHTLAEDVEEERRVMHVGITRGRETVLVNATATRGPDASPFVSELLHRRPADRPWPTGAGSTRSDGSARNRDSAPATGRARGGGPAPRREPSGPGEAARREALTEWRRERSRTDGVPAYIVFDNATLDAIAAGSPSTLGDLGKVKGIGPAKLERYGADVLAVLADQAPG
ncbi:MAG: UvrD-helicase domain-containing protein [Acidimicrobiales bacterium]